MKKGRYIIPALMLWVCLVMVVMVAGPLDAAGGKNKKDSDPFYEKVRFIMSKEEIRIYKHLSDQAAREEFITEFWQKRDPTPETPENENFDEYRLRIAFAVKWFKEASKGKGWDTERGRILLQLGFPDKRDFKRVGDTVGGRLTTTKRTPMELWVYERYGLMLVFAETGDSGRMRLTRVPPNFSYALNRSKFSLDLRTKTKQSFEFEAEYNGKKQQFEVTIPVKKISFEKVDNAMTADFDVNVYIYLNNKKYRHLKKTETFSKNPEELLKLKHILLEMPYTLTEKGKYYFDVILREKSSSAMYRDFTKFKY